MLFRSSVVIREIPSMLNMKTALEMIKSLFENAKSDMDTSTHHTLAEKACKAAIKAHDVISKEEQLALIDLLRNLEAPYTCPHGRPIIIRFALSEIERKFKRII